MKQTFKMHVHDVCSKFASSCKQGISCTWRGTAPCADLAYTGSLAVTPLGWDAMYSVHQSLVVTIITTSDNVTHTTNVCTSNYYGAVLPRRRSHYVSMLSVCPSVRPSVPCLHLEKKQKGLGRPNLVGRVPGTNYKVKGSEVKVRAANCVVCKKIPITSLPVVRSTWYLAGGVRIPCRLAPGALVAMATAFPPSVRTQLQGWSHSGRPLNGRTLLLYTAQISDTEIIDWKA